MPSQFAIDTGGELYADGGVSEVDPMADVPRPDPAAVREGLEASRQFADAENAAGYGKGQLGFRWSIHALGLPAIIRAGVAAGAAKTIPRTRSSVSSVVATPA